MGARTWRATLGASGASWTQTSFQLGDADVTDPDRTGFAMLYPNLDALQGVSVTTAGLHPSGFGSGTAVMLVPKMPAAAWQRTIEFFGSPPALQSVGALPNAPSVARLRAAGGASFILSGPVNDRLGVHVVGALTGSSRLEGDGQDSIGSRIGSLSAHLVYAASPRDDVRVLIQTDRLSLPAAAVHCSSIRDWSSTITRCCSHPRGITQPAPVSQRRPTSPTVTLRRRPLSRAAPSSARWSDCETVPLTSWRLHPTARRHRGSISWRADPGPLTFGDRAIGFSSAAKRRGQDPRAALRATRSSANLSTDNRRAPGTTRPMGSPRGGAGASCRCGPQTAFR